MDAICEHVNGKDTGREQSFYVVTKSGLISKETIYTNSRLSIKTSMAKDLMPTVLFPNHAFEASKIRNCCGYLVLRKVATNSRVALRLSVIQNLSPFSSPSRFSVFDWKEEVVGVTPSFLFSWRNSWTCIEQYFSKSREVDVDSVVCFVNIVASHPDVALCFPSSIIDSEDGLLQSSYEGADYVEGVPVVRNNCPTLFLPSKKSSKRKRRMLGSDSSIQWKKLILHTTPRAIDEVYAMIHHYAEGLMASPLIYGNFCSAESVKICLVTKSDFLEMSKVESRSIDDHNMLLLMMARKVLELTITIPNSSGHLVVSILSRRDRSYELESIEEATVVAPASFVSRVCDDINTMTLDLIKVMPQPKTINLKDVHINITRKCLDKGYPQRGSTLKSGSLNYYEGRRGNGESTRAASNLLEGPGDVHLFPFYRNHFVDGLMPSVTRLHRELTDVAKSLAVQMDPVMVKSCAKLLGLNDARLICCKSILTMGLSNSNISFYCSFHRDSSDRIRHVDKKLWRALSSEERMYAKKWLKTFGFLSVPTTCSYEFVGQFLCNVANEDVEVWLFMLFLDLGIAVPLLHHMVLQFAANAIGHNTSIGLVVYNKRVYYRSKLGTVFAWGGAGSD